MLSARPDKINGLIWRVFTKSNGLTLKTEAVGYLKERMDWQRLEESEILDVLNFIATTYKKQGDRPTLVDVESLAAALEGMEKLNIADSKLAKDFITVLNANECPRWDYDSNRRRFFLTHDSNATNTFTYFGEGAEAKIEMFKRQYEITRQRVLRTEQFSGPTAVKLTTIKSIKGQQKLKEKKVLLGMLSEMKEGSVFLEDLEDQVLLDFSKIDMNDIIPAAYTETCMVIIGGVPNGNSFTVQFISPPPVETRMKTLQCSSFPLYTAFLSDSIIQIAKQVEGNYLDQSIVVIADLWLDCPRTMKKFEELMADFTLLKSPIPSAFILQGPFLSIRTDPRLSIAKHILTLLRRLIDLINAFPIIANQTKFIIQLSIDDPLAAKLLPKAAWPIEFMDPFKNAGIDVVFITNPARMFFFTKELFILRDNLSTKLKSSILPGMQQFCIESSQLDSFKTIINQGHCSPFSLNSDQPRAWEFDHSLTLYPLPDYLICSESTNPIKSVQNGCLCINAGSFATSEFTFTQVYPLTGNVEIKRV